METKLKQNGNGTKLNGNIMEMKWRQSGNKMEKLYTKWKWKMIENQHSDNETGYLPITKLTPEQTVIICDNSLQMKQNTGRHTMCLDEIPIVVFVAN